MTETTRQAARQATGDELARFADALVRGLVREVNSGDQLDGFDGLPARASVLSGPVAGLRLVGEDADAVIHAVPRAFDEWEVRAWFADAPDDAATARLALQAAELSSDPVTVSVPVRDAAGPLLAASREAHLLDVEGTVFRSLMSSHYSALMQAMRRVRFEAAFGPLERAASGLKVVGAGGGMPFTAEGTWHGEHRWVFRYRHGSAWLRVSAYGEDPYERTYWESRVEYGHPLAGDLTYFETARLFARLAGMLERAQWDYEFEVSGALKPITVGSRGRSAEEALHTLKTRSSFALAGLAPALSVPVEDLVFTLVGDDDRVFPAVMPDFSIRLEAR